MIEPEMRKLIHKKVQFKDGTYWLHEVTPGLFNLSELTDYNEKGELLVDPFTAISFGVVYQDKILQFGETIGTMADLVTVEETK